MSGRGWAAVLAGAGLLVAGYLTLVHYTGLPLACPSQGAIDCEAVLSSRYATVAGVPTALLGVAWFAAALVLLWRRPAWLRPWAWIGAAAVVALVYTELFLVGAICLWCSTVHALVLAILVLVEVGAVRGGRSP